MSEDHVARSILSRNTTEFQVRCFEVLTTKIGNNEVLDMDSLRKCRDDKFNKRGVYIFALGIGGGVIKPMYVGRTVKRKKSAGTFRERFTRTHIAKSIPGHHGRPLLFLLFPKKGKGRANAIVQLERDIIFDAYWLNPNLLNDRQTPKFAYRIQRVFPAVKGRMGSDAENFRKMLKW